MPDHELVMLAALIADGDLTQRTPRFSYGADSPVLDEVCEAAAAFGVSLRGAPGSSGGTATISGGRGARANPVRELCEQHGLWGRRSGDKFVPAAIFALDDASIARFLAVLYACDGRVYAVERLRQIGYTTISERLAFDVQHLLLRLGIVARIRALRRPVYDGTDTVAREVLITGQEGLTSCCRLVQVSRELELLATSDLWWDEVASVEYVGEDDTFDLTVPGDHNFVADDVVVHNSALVTNIAENVALDKERRRAVALFSLEMSEAELAQRFIASQASIKGDDLRKGRLKDESKWKRVLRVAAEYDAAPLFVDDSSDLGILDLRAKARRLHQQAPDGLGLIIVDYLQLMRADARIESRVQQVGDISRGLKILARELDVPVIALSQLSRGVESRTDKRPMLSDLRESGQIEQDADLVVFIYRDEYYNPETTERPGEAELIIAKHRNGGLGEVPLTFQNEYPRFLGMQRAA
jgi:replicative DNA helicase